MSAAISFTGGSNNNKEGLVGTVALNAGDFKLRASTIAPTFVAGPAFEDLSLSFSLEKPGSFIVDYDVPNKDVRFQFMNKMKFFEKQLNMTYTHSRIENRIGLNATLLLDSANKIWGSYGFGSGDCKVKYSFVQGGIRTIEPCYDVSNNSWDFSVSQRVLDGDLVKAFYKTSSKVLGLEWSSQSVSNQGGRFKVIASLNLGEGLHIPKLTAESTWNFDI